MCIINDHVFLRGWEDAKHCIRVFNRTDPSLTRDIESPCKHFSFNHSICEHPVDTNSVLETCHECRQIRSYDIKTGEARGIYSDGKVSTTCLGPPGSLLRVDNTGRLLRLNWDDERQNLKVVHSVQTNITDARQICYIEQHDAVVFVCPSSFRVTTVNLTNGTPMWELTQQQVCGKNIKPTGLCYNVNGHIYVTDRDNKRLLVLNAEKGELLQVVQLAEGKSDIWAVCWTSTQPELTVIHGGGCCIRLYSLN